MGTKAKASAPRQLINHRDVAELFGTSPRNWRRWYETGVVPIPHQMMGTLLLYDLKVINHRLETGEWPPGMEFRRPPVPAGEGRSSASDDAIRPE
jgi:hypothetical protein